MSTRPIRAVCIDDGSSFLNLIDEVLSQERLREEVRQECRRSEDSFRTCWRWLESRDCSAPIATSAFNCLLAELSGAVTHVHAFHGCRVTQDSTYDVDGIKPLTGDFIAKEVTKWAGTLPNPYSEAGRLLESYLAGYSGRVCAVKSLVTHQENGGYGHSLGSEALRNILALHCPSALARMLQAGEPTIIEFRIPVPELKSNAWPNYVADLFRLWLSKQVEFSRPSDPRQGGIVLGRPVPPQWLLRRHVCDVSGKLTGEVHEYSVGNQRGHAGYD